LSYDEDNLNSAVEWLCRTDQVEDDGREDEIYKLTNLDVVRDIIEAKWHRTFLKKYRSSQLNAIAIMVLTSLLALFTDAGPKETTIKNYDYWDYSDNTTIHGSIIYLLLGILLSVRVIRQLPLMINEGIQDIDFESFSLTPIYFIKAVIFTIWVIFLSWWFPSRFTIGMPKFYCKNTRTRGLVVVGRWLHIVMVALTCTLLTARYLMYKWGSTYNTTLMTLCIFCVAALTLTSYVNILYYYLADPHTGAFLFVVYKIIARDVPNFLNYYAVILIAFAYHT